MGGTLQRLLLNSTRCPVEGGRGEQRRELFFLAECVTFTMNIFSRSHMSTGLAMNVNVEYQ